MACAKQLKDTMILSIRYGAIMRFLTLSILCILLLESTNAEEPHPRPMAALSEDQVYTYEKSVAQNPQAGADKFRVLVQSDDTFEVHGSVTGRKWYEITVPWLHEMDPKMENRGFKGCTGARVSDGGDLLLNYYSVTRVLYRKSENTYIVLPRTLMVNQQKHNISSWNWLAGTMLEGTMENPEQAGMDHVVYHVDSRKVHKLETPDHFQSPKFLLRNVDTSRGIVEVKSYVLEDPEDAQSDIQITGTIGYYRIVKKAADP